MADILHGQIALKQVSSDTYTVGWHVDWTLGSTLFGGSITAMIHAAASAHLKSDPTLAARNQPDVLGLHVDFLRPCNRCESRIVVDSLKIGATTCTIQLHLSQNDQLKAIAMATSTNFERPLGPTVTTQWRLLPPPKPVPDFERVVAHLPDDNWLPACYSGDIIATTKNILVLNPRGGFTVDGICDGWYGLVDDTQCMDATYVSMMTDIIPSMSDTLLRNDGLYDAHAFFAKLERWAVENPGVPAQIENSLAEAMRATVYNQTASVDIEFKRRIPPKTRFLFNRVVTKMLREGRMDLEMTMCDESMGILCSARQLILVLDAERKFRPVSGTKSSL
ncbi:thioesterase family protein [Nemania sp. FL0916]|nr:thioesterase family protein [Nemania sp. FL0916]